MLLRNPWHRRMCLVHQTIAVNFFIYVDASQETFGMAWFNRMRSSMSMSYTILDETLLM